MSTIERPYLTRKQREAIADKFAESGSLGSWGEYLANAAVDHAIAQAAAESREDKAANKIMRMALHKLACLGNAPLYGNSEGNTIAQQALAVVDRAELAEREVAEDAAKTAEILALRERNAELARALGDLIRGCQREFDWQYAPEFTREFDAAWAALTPSPQSDQEEA